MDQNGNLNKPELHFDSSKDINLEEDGATRLIEAAGQTGWSQRPDGTIYHAASGLNQRPDGIVVAPDGRWLNPYDQLWYAASNPKPGAPRSLKDETGRYVEVVLAEVIDDKQHVVDESKSEAREGGSDETEYSQFVEERHGNEHRDGAEAREEPHAAAAPDNQPEGGLTN